MQPTLVIGDHRGDANNPDPWLLPRQAFGDQHSPGILLGAGLEPVPLSAEAQGREGFDQQRHLLRKGMVVALPPVGGRQMWQGRETLQGETPLSACRAWSRSKESRPARPKALAAHRPLTSRSPNGSQRSAGMSGQPCSQVIWAVEIQERVGQGLQPLE